MARKRYLLSRDEIEPLAEGRGACLATDRITVDGERVGCMYREAPDEPADSGWRFTAGSESDAYLDDPANSSVFDLNTIANYDPEIVPLLDAPVGSTFVRWPPGAPLRPEPDDPPAEPRRRSLAGGWTVEVEAGFVRRRVPDAVELVAAGPPARTIWLEAWDAPPGADRAGLIADIRSSRRPHGADVFEETAPDGSLLYGSWYSERVDGRDQWVLYGYTLAASSHAEAAFVVATPDLAWALRTWRSLRHADGG